MKMDLKKTDDKLTIHLEGSIDTITAPDLENELKAQYEGLAELILDFSAVNFLSSAGIRVILWAHKKMNGRLILRNVSENIREVFELTGLNAVLNFE